MFYIREMMDFLVLVSLQGFIFKCPVYKETHKFISISNV